MSARKQTKRCKRRKRRITGRRERRRRGKSVASLWTLLRKSRESKVLTSGQLCLKRYIINDP